MSIIALQKQQPHPRKIIRNQVKKLMRENTLMSQKWFCSRPHPLFLQEIPCGLIYFIDENNDVKDTRPKTYYRTLNLVTEVQIRQETEIENDMDDWLDSRSFEIEAAMMNDRFLGLGDRNFVQDVSLSRTQCVQIQYEGDADVASLRMFWEITYQTQSWNPLSLDEFLRFNAEYIGQVGNGARAEDHVTIREE